MLSRACDLELLIPQSVWNLASIEQSRSVYALVLLYLIRELHASVVCIGGLVYEARDAEKWHDESLRQVSISFYEVANLALATLPRIRLYFLRYLNES